MANTKSRSLGPGLSPAEQVAGFCYLPFYVGLLAWCIRYLSDLFGLNLSSMQINICYFVLNFIIIWAIFHRFLIHSFHSARIRACTTSQKREDRKLRTRKLWKITQIIRKFKTK